MRGQILPLHYSYNPAAGIIRYDETSYVFMLQIHISSGSSFLFNVVLCLCFTFHRWAMTEQMYLSTLNKY